MIAAVPRAMNMMIAVTLIPDSTVSASAKTLTEAMLSTRTRMMKVAAHTHTGTPGNQPYMIIAAPVNSLPRATVHVSQYRMAVTKPVAGPRYWRA